jgi:Rps23 Pro-64 3,4-dihydroxylase Tpa1-like proline 4-hydroxylase
MALVAEWAPKKTGSANSATATLRTLVKRLSYNAWIIITLIIFNSKNSSRLTVLLSKYFSWKYWQQMGNLLHRGMSSSIPRWYQSLSCVISRRVHNCFHLAIIFKFAAAKILLQRWERTMTNR